MSLYQNFARQREFIINIMKQGGYYERMMDSGSELNRVKTFLRMIEGIQPVLKGEPYQLPTLLPIFPGLNAQCFHDRENDPIAQYIECNYPLIKLDIVNTRTKALENINLPISWKVKALWYLGVDLSFIDASMPNVKKLMQNLPNSAKRFPLAEAIISWFEPFAHLPMHSSTDGLRLRYSLGVVVDDFCELRVGSSRKQWVEGQCIIFEDCFEHEAWNGSKDRAVLIIDTWHPDLTPIEKEALTEGFAKREIREIIYHYRPIEAIKNLIHKKFEHEESMVSARYWDLNKKIISPSLAEISKWKQISVQF